MKKLLFIILFTLFSISLFSQKKTCENTKKNIIGYWYTKESSTDLFFWKNKDGNLECQEVSNTSGEVLDTFIISINKNKIVVKTKSKNNNWIIKSTYSFINNKTLKCVMTGNYCGTIIYTKQNNQNKKWHLHKTQEDPRF